MEDNGIGIDDWDMPIYRIFTTKWFEELITKKSNGLVNPQLWEDPFENFFLRNVAVASDGTEVSLKSIAESWYGQCWTTNMDSDAMWRIYSPNKDGVRVKTTVRKLFMSVYDSADPFVGLKYLIGKVEYVSRAEIEKFLKTTTFTDLALGGQPHGFAKTLCIKRPEFSHEAEVRLLFQDTGSDRGRNGVAVFPFDPDALLSEVALDPRLEQANYEAERDRLKALGCNVPIVQSELYKVTPTKIRLD